MNINIKYDLELMTGERVTNEQVITFARYLKRGFRVGRIISGSFYERNYEKRRAAANKLCSTGFVEWMAWR